MNYETVWGPWIEHDGRPMPGLLGCYVNSIGETPDGEYSEVEYFLRRDDLIEFDWSKFQTLWNGWIIGRVLRYRVGKPRSKHIETLLEIARDPKPMRVEELA